MMRVTRLCSSFGSSVLEKYSRSLHEYRGTWEQIIPKSTASSNLDFFDAKDTDPTGLDFSLNIVWDLLNRKGKKVRPVLVLLAGDTYQIDRSRSLPIAFMTETVHNATLIIDDIEDKSEFRRGEPCSYLKFGVDNSINAGCLAYFLPVDRALASPAIRQLPVESQLGLYQTYISEMKNLHLGMAWDIYWHNQTFTPATLPSEDSYLKMVESKTSVLMRIGLKMVAIVGQLPHAEVDKLARLANHIGISFQIQDDIINLESLDYSKGRGGLLGDDITEGKITLMVIKHLELTKDQRLLDLLALKTKDPQLIGEAIDRMRDSGAISYCHQVKEANMMRAIDLLEQLAAPRDKKEDFRAVLSELLHRSK